MGDDDAYAPQPREPAEKALFLAAIELPNSERETFVRKSCGNDAGLRDRVLRLLAGDALAAADAAFDRVTFTLAPPLFPPDGGESVEPIPPREAGTEIGNYVLEALVGSGGHGEVWRVRQVRPVERDVALKLLTGASSADQGVRTAFERQALARLDHPDVARVLDAGTWNGAPYLVVELSPGDPISDFCLAQNLPARERMALFERVCLAVSHAHGRGLIHCDLKPANVLVWRDTDGGAIHVKVIDFGVARPVATDLVQGGPATNGDELAASAGTPAFMAPEQATGEAVDVRTDVYALGLLLHAMFGGSNPILAAARSTRSRRALIDAASAAPRPGPLLPPAPREAHWIIARATQPKPADRFASASDLASEARRYLEGQPLVCGPNRLSYRLARHAARNWPLTAATAAAVVLLVGGTLTTAVQAIRAARAEALALQRRDDAEAARSQAEASLATATAALADAQAAEVTARQESEAARATSRFLQNVLFGAAPSHTDAVGAAAMARSLNRARDGLKTDLQDYPEVRAGLLDTIGQIYFTRHELEEAEPLLREAWQIRSAIYAEDDPRTLKSLSMLANTLSYAGRLDEAIELNEKLMELIDQRRLESDHIVRLNAYLTAAELLRSRSGPGDLDKLRTLAAQAEAGIPVGPPTRTTLANRLMRAHVLMVVATKLAGSEVPDDADEALHLSALALDVSADLGPTQVDRITLETDRARILLLLQRESEAYALLQDLMPRARQRFGVDGLGFLLVAELWFSVRSDRVLHGVDTEDVEEVIDGLNHVYQATRDHNAVRCALGLMKLLEREGQRAELIVVARDALADGRDARHRHSGTAEYARAVLARNESDPTTRPH